MSKAQRMETKFQEKQRAKAALMKSLALKGIRDYMAKNPPPTRPSKPSMPNASTPISGTGWAGGFSSGTWEGYSTGTSTTIPITGSGGTPFWNSNVTFGEAVFGEAEIEHPQDDPTRAMAETRIFEALLGCLADNHYPAIIKVSSTVLAALGKSPLTGHQYTMTFMGIPISVLDGVDDPWFIAVGWQDA